MPRILITNLAQLEAFQSRIRVLRATLPFIQKAAIKNYASDVVLDEIHAKMELEEFSPKIIDATFVGPTIIAGKTAKIHFISDYKTDSGFDVSKAREEGTTHPNPTFPKKKGGVLRWIAKTGEIIFRKRSHPKGIERLLIIEKTIKKNQGTALQTIQDSISEKALKVLGV